MKSGKSETIGANLIRKLLTVQNIPVELFEGQRKANLELQGLYSYIARYKSDNSDNLELLRFI
jgi:hypothetical protein